MKAKKADKPKKEVKNIFEVKNKYSCGWYVRFNKNGVKVNKTFAFNPNKPNDRQEAYEDAVKWRNEEWGSITHKAVSIETTSQLTLRPLLEEYLATETPKKKPSGADSETYRINRILNDTDKFKALIDKPIVKLGKDDFSALSNHLRNVGVERTVVSGKKVDGKYPTKTKPAKPMSADTANRHIGLFSCVFDWAMKQDKYNWIEKNLAAGHNVKVEERRKAIPTSDDLDKVLALTDSKYLKIALVLGFETGARRGEIMSLKWDDIKLARNLRANVYPHIQFWGLDGSQKNLSTSCKIVPLSDRAFKLLNGFDEKARWGYLFKDDNDTSNVIKGGSITQAFKRARERAAEKYSDERYLSIVFHGSRGRFITNTAQIKGISPLVVAALSGHKNLDVIIEHYFDPKVKELAEQMGLIKKKSATKARSAKRTG